MPPPPRSSPVDPAVPPTGDTLEVRLATEVAGCRAAWRAATRRSQAALRSGDPARVDAALDAQRVLLARTREQLAALVATATRVDRAPLPRMVRDHPAAAGGRQQAPGDPSPPRPRGRVGGRPDA